MNNDKSYEQKYFDALYTELTTNSSPEEVMDFFMRAPLEEIAAHYKPDDESRAAAKLRHQQFVEKHYHKSQQVLGDHQLSIHCKSSWCSCFKCLCHQELHLVL